MTANRPAPTSAARHPGAIAAFLILALIGLAPRIAHAQAGLTSQWVYHPISSPSTVAYSPNGSLIAVGGEGGVQIYTVSTGQLATCLPTGAGQVNSVAFSPDGTTLAVGGSVDFYTSGPVIELWNVSTGKLTRSLASAAGIVNSVAFSPDGATLADGGQWTGTLEIWNVAAGKLTVSLKTGESVVNSVQFSPDGSTLAAGGSANSGLIELWNVAGEKLVQSIPSATTTMTCIALSPDGQSVVGGGYLNNDSTGTTTGIAEVWDVAGGAPKTSLETNSYLVDSVAYSPDGKTIAIGEWITESYNGGITLWNASSFNLISTLTATNHPEVHSIAFAPGGQSIAAFGIQFDTNPSTTFSELDTWDVSSGNQTAAIDPDPYNAGFTVAFSPDGSNVILGGDLGRVEPAGGWIGVWNSATSKFLLTLPSAAGAGVTSVAMTPDNSKLVDSGRSPTGPVLEVWDVAKGSLIQSLPTAATLKLGAISISPDGTTLADGGQSTVLSGILELWNIATATMVDRLGTAANEGITSLAYSPNGANLVASGLGEAGGYLFGVLEVWNPSKGSLLRSLSTTLFSPSSVAISPDSTTLVVGGLRFLESENKTECAIEVWNLTTYSLSGYLPVSASADLVSALSFSPDGLTLFAATNIGIQSFSPAGGTLLANYPLGAVTGLAVSPKGGQVAYVSSSNLLAVAAAPLYATVQIAAVTLNPSAVSVGQSSTATITLAQPAPPGGAIVILSSSNAAANVPAAVSVESGATTATFKVTTSAVNAQTSATVSATSGASSQSATLTVNPATLSSITLTQSSMIGGNNCLGALTLTGPAGSEGLVVHLSSSNVAITPVSQVLISAGETLAPFYVASTAVSVRTNCTVTASLGGQSVTVNITVIPAVLSSLTVSPLNVTAGSSATGTIRLTGLAPSSGFVVTLSSNNPMAVVPKSVTLASEEQGQSFTVTTSGGLTNQLAIISATMGTVTKTSALAITPLKVELVAVNPGAVAGGESTRGYVTLNGAAPKGGLTVQLSSNSASAVVPATVNVPAGAAAATFTVKTSAVTTQKVATITAKLAASSAASALTIIPPSLSTLTLNPSAVDGGTPTTGTVSISSIAPSGGFAITLSSTLSSATVPASVTIPAGKTSVTFTVKTKAVKSATTTTIAATHGATSLTATLTIS